MDDERKPWFVDGLENFVLGKFKQDFRFSMSEFQKEYFINTPCKKQNEGCETKSLKGDEFCPEDGIERLIDDQTVYLCDKCYESYMQRITKNEYKKTMIYINDFKQNID